MLIEYGKDMVLWKSERHYQRILKIMILNNEGSNEKLNSSLDWKYESVDTVAYLSLHDCE